MVISLVEIRRELVGRLLGEGPGLVDPSSSFARAMATSRQLCVCVDET
jgi:hypothetical protein